VLKVFISIFYDKNIILILNYVFVLKFEKFFNSPIFNNIKKSLIHLL